MRQFNVLSKDLNIHSNYLLEASAGTGKTFSIENIVVRLLIEEHPSKKVPLKINEILVVTFTRAATRDLITRIRQNITSCLNLLEMEEAAGDHYLAKIQSEGKEAVEKAQRALEDALFCFDQAQIYTIHGFCSKTLREHVFEGNISLDTNFAEQLSNHDIQSVVRNVIRSEVCNDKYCSEQIDRLLGSHQRQYENLEKSLIKLITQEGTIAESPTFSEEFATFKTTLEQLRSEHKLVGEKLLSDYETLKPYCKKLRPPSDPDASIEHFCSCLDGETLNNNDFRKMIANGLTFYNSLHPDNRKKIQPKEPLDLHYPDLLLLLEETLLPIIQRVSSPEVTLTRLAHDCKKHLQHYCANEEKVNFNEILLHMGEAAKNRFFRQNVQKQYAVAIIDEFQDTDPIQWNIFKELFLSESGERYLYLVGDPKQAIYSFRQADIYTYLSAADSLGEEHIASLDTNYRSTPEMIDALNTLFSSDTAHQLIPLPQLEKTLPYHPVKAGKNEPTPDFGDSLSAVNFCMAFATTKRSNLFPLEQMETEQFFPHIAQEISKVRFNTVIPLKEIAILVSDRFQAERLSKFLHNQNLPHILQRSTSLAESPALKAMREVILAAIDPKDQSAVKTALGGQIIRYTHTRLIDLIDTPHIESIIETFYILRKKLFELGFSAFFEELIYSTWPEKERCVLQTILSSSDGIELYDDLQQIAEILMEYQSKSNPSPEGLLAYLDEFDELSQNDDPRIKRRRDPQSDAINIITMHSSKGLEYGVVYALATLKRGSSPDKIVPIPTKNGRVIKPILDASDPDYLTYCREIDAEKMRLLYVGMTRAKYRLYIPLACVDKSKVAYGCASPMDLYLSKIGETQPDTYEEMYEKIQIPDPSPLQDVADKSPHISLVKLDSVDLPPTAAAEESPPPITVPPKKVSVPGCDLFMQSFSSLTKSHTATSLSDEPAPADFLCEEKTPFTLPAGSETGNLLHLILETLDFKESNIQEHVDRYTRGTKYEMWTDVICEMIDNVVSATIDNFCLRETAQNSSYRELEFIYPISSTTPYVEEVEYLPGYLKGIIDLVIKINSRYYIVDWKSNWLGNTIDSYSQEQMKSSVIDHQYFLQAALYKEALRRYLALVEQAPFDEIYGGTYYVYLRGISKDSKATGVIALDQQFSNAGALES